MCVHMFVQMRSALIYCRIDVTRVSSLMSYKGFPCDGNVLYVVHVGHCTSARDAIRTVMRSVALCVCARSRDTTGRYISRNDKKLDYIVNVLLRIVYDIVLKISYNKVCNIKGISQINENLRGILREIIKTKKLDVSTFAIAI